MPDRHDETKTLEGEVSETPTSDAVIARDFQQRENEFFALTGKRITARPIGSISAEDTQILKPGTFTSEKVDSDIASPAETTRVVVNFEDYQKNPSGVGRSLVEEKKQKRAA